MPARLTPKLKNKFFEKSAKFSYTDSMGLLDSDGERLCTKCWTWKELDGFRLTSKGYRLTQCLNCTRTSQRESQRQLRLARYGHREHHRRKGARPSVVDGKKRCTICEEWKVVEEFAFRNKRIDDRRSSWCRKCKNFFAQACRGVWRKKSSVKSARIFSYKHLTNNPCEHCGEDDVRTLQFHHVDPKTKIYTVSAARSVSIEAVKAEMSKCIVLCANCHSKVTAEARSWCAGLPI